MAIEKAKELDDVRARSHSQLAAVFRALEQTRGDVRRVCLVMKGSPKSVIVLLALGLAFLVWVIGWEDRKSDEPPVCSLPQGEGNARGEAAAVGEPLVMGSPGDGPLIYPAPVDEGTAGPSRAPADGAAEEERSSSEAASGLGVLLFRAFDRETMETIDCSGIELYLRPSGYRREFVSWSGSHLEPVSGGDFREMELPVGTWEMVVIADGPEGRAYAPTRTSVEIQEATASRVELALSTGCTLDLRTSDDAEALPQGSFLVVLEESRCQAMTYNAERQAVVVRDGAFLPARYPLVYLDRAGHGTVRGLAVGRYCIRVCPPGVTVKPDEVELAEGSSTVSLSFTKESAR